jgi:myo-inositol-1(or 4)-monophosphatase
VSLDRAQLAELADTAEDILDAAEKVFRAEVGAAQEVIKGVGDWATAADLAIERQVAAALRDRTGFAVHGEEFGGPSLTEGTAWVLDPIDGTANYTSRVPLCGISLGLVQDGEPVVGLIRLPLLGERYHGVDGTTPRRNGSELPVLPPGDLSEVTVALGTVAPKAHRSPEPYPFAFRTGLANAVAHRALRTRMFGSSSVELAWATCGAVGATISFGNHAWDNVAGVLLIRSAGGAVRDLEGQEWSLASTSIVAGAGQVVTELTELVAEFGEHGPRA